MKNKRILSLVLALALCLGFCMPAYAAAKGESKAEAFWGGYKIYLNSEQSLEQASIYYDVAKVAGGSGISYAGVRLVAKQLSGWPGWALGAAAFSARAFGDQCVKGAKNKGVIMYCTPPIPISTLILSASNFDTISPIIYKIDLQ